MNYKLEVTEKQLQVIKLALECYFRERMGQFFELPDDLAFDGYDREERNPVDFDDRIARRDAGKALLDSAYKLMHPDWNSPKSPEMLMAQDMWDVIKHELWENQPQEVKDTLPWCVDARTPLHLSEEPMIKVEVCDD